LSFSQSYQTFDFISLFFDKFLIEYEVLIAESVHQVIEVACLLSFGMKYSFVMIYEGGLMLIT
jgi:hypothetical protein